MKKQDNVWNKNAYLGSTILYSNTKNSNYHMIFAGAEPLLQENIWKINFIFSYNPIYTTCKAGYAGNMCAICKLGDKIRFENYLGIKEEVSIKTGPGEEELHVKFFPIQFIKLTSIETDFITYEIHCI